MPEIAEQMWSSLLVYSQRTAYQMVSPLNAMPRTMRNLSYSPGYVGRPTRLKAVSPTAAMTFTHWLTFWTSTSESTTITIGTAIRTATPSHVAWLIAIQPTWPAL